MPRGIALPGQGNTGCRVRVAGAVGARSAAISVGCQRCASEKLAAMVCSRVDSELGARRLAPLSIPAHQPWPALSVALCPPHRPQRIDSQPVEHSAMLGPALRGRSSAGFWSAAASAVAQGELACRPPDRASRDLRRWRSSGCSTPRRACRWSRPKEARAVAPAAAIGHRISALTVSLRSPHAQRSARTPASPYRARATSYLYSRSC